MGTIKVKLSEIKSMIREVLEEESGYQEFFKSKLKQYGVDSPAQLDDEKKKKFFDEIEKEWTGEKNETLEPVSQAAGNPLKGVKAKKVAQILASEAKVEKMLRKMIREELTFLMYSDEKNDGHVASRKVQKKRKRLGVSV